MDEIFTANYKLLFGRAIKLCKTTPWISAEDLVHDTYIAAVKNQHKLKNKRNIKGWLLRILYNKYIDALRQASKRIGYEDTLLYYKADDRRLGPAEELLCKEWNRKAVEVSDMALRDLAPKLWEAMSLFLKGSKPQEIARTLGISLPATQSRIGQARKLSKKLLDEYDFGLKDIGAGRIEKRYMHEK